MAGVELGDMDLRFAWQAWHLDIERHFVWQAWHFMALRACWSPVTPRLFAGQASLMALGWRSPVTPRLFAWQAWRLVPWTSFCVAGVALGDMDFRSAWQAWHLDTSSDTLVAGDAAAVCLAGVALGDIDRHLVWQAWHLWWSPVTPRLFARQVWHLVPWTFVCVEGVALGDMDLRFARQAWHLDTSSVTFVWQAWQSWHWAGCDALRAMVTGDAADVCVVSVALDDMTFVLRGNRAVWTHRASLCVAGVALGDMVLRFAWQVALGHIERHFVWQAWHLWHWARSRDVLRARWSPVTLQMFVVTWAFVLCGK
eukprot:s183_g5.t1